MADGTSQAAAAGLIGLSKALGRCDYPGCGAILAGISSALSSVVWWERGQQSGLAGEKRGTEVRAAVGGQLRAAQHLLDVSHSS